MKYIAGLQYLNNGAARLVWPLGFKDRLVEIVVETLPLRIDALDPVALEDPQQLALGSRDPGEETARALILRL